MPRHGALDTSVPALHALPEARTARWSLDVDPVGLYQPARVTPKPYDGQSEAKPIDRPAGKTKGFDVGPTHSSVPFFVSRTRPSRWGLKNPTRLLAPLLPAAAASEQ